jgi:hypothetical protein
MFRVFAESCARVAGDSSRRGALSCSGALHAACPRLLAHAARSLGAIFCVFGFMAYSLGSSWSGCFSAAPFFVRPTTAHFIAADRRTTGHDRYKAPLFDPASGDAQASPHKAARAQEEQHQLKQQQQQLHQQQAVDQQTKQQREQQIMSSPPVQNAVDFGDARSAPTPAQQPQPKKAVNAG